MKTITIDGQLFGIRLPFGGAMKDDRNNEWDRALDAGCRLKWGQQYSWCLERPDTAYHVIRGGETARHWGLLHSSCRGSSVGFRPVLIPLDPTTSDPDLSIFAGRDGETIELGSASDTNEDFHIGNTEEGPSIKWGVFDGKLIALTVLTSRVSWTTLSKSGFCPLAKMDAPPAFKSKSRKRMHLVKKSGVSVDIELSVADIVDLIQKCDDPEALKYIARCADRQAEVIEQP